MTVKFEDFPAELWVELERWLSVSDLLQLRVTNKKMLENISQQQMWKRICYRDWYKYILDEEDIYNRATDKRIDYTKIDDWCVQARRLYHGDYHFLHRIEKLTMLPLNKEFWNKFDIILKGKEDNLLPILYKITTQECERNSNIKYGLELKACAQHLLDNILHRAFYEQAWRSGECLLPGTDNLEPIFLDIAKFDIAYPVISGKVLEVRERVRNRIEKEIQGEWNAFCSDTILNKTRIVVKVTLGELRIGHCKKNIPKHKYFDEDYYITRIYAGEVIGHHFILLVVLQSICRQYNIKASLSTDYLIVDDPSSTQGKFYFKINISDIDSGFKTVPEVEDIVLRQALEMAEDEENAEEIEEYCNERLVSLSALECLDYVMTKILLDADGSIIYNYGGFSDTQANENDYSVIYVTRLDRQYFDCFEMRKHVEKLFPYSKQQVLRCSNYYMVEVYESIRKLCSDPWAKICDYRFRRTRIEEYSELKKKVKIQFPWDYSHIMGSSAVVKVCDYAEGFLDKANIFKYDENYKNIVNVGTFMRQYEKDLVLIVSQPASGGERYNPENGTVERFDCLGRCQDFSMRNLDNGATFPITIEEKNAFVDLIGPTNILGRIFSSYDRTTGKGTLNLKMRDTMKRELEKYRLLTVKMNNHKRTKYK